MNIPFCIFSLIAIPFCLTPIKSNKAILQRLQEVDWLGSLLLTGAMTSFLVGITLVCFSYLAQSKLLTSTGWRCRGVERMASHISHSSRQHQLDCYDGLVLF